ncbi:MAG: SRPBCC family protein [Chloroflexota bacterium]
MSRGQVRLRQAIAAPPDVVFAYLTNLARSPEWDPAVKQVTPMTRGPLRKGTVLRGTLDVAGETYHVDDEVTELDPPWRFAIRSVQGGADGIAYALSLDDEGRTALEATLSYDLPDPPPGAARDSASLRQELIDGLTGSLEALKALIEREAAPST